MNKISKIVFFIGLGMLLVSTIVSVSASIKFNSSEVSYDNTASGITATNVETAINELTTSLDSGVSTLSSKVGSATLNTTASNLSDAINEINSNKILYSSTGMYMQSGQTATLSQTVSSQTNGIIMVFDGYANSAPQDWGWNFCIVPKYHTINYNGGAVACRMANSNFSNNATKYVYVYDDKITGHSTNNVNSSASGITYKGLDYVLRYVIGF